VVIQHEQWWQKRTTVVLLALAAMLPLLWPTIPPLVDLPGHMGRYRVQLDYTDSAILRDFYSFKWSLIGNLGVDLLIVPISKIFGLELGTKLIVMSIPALTVAGLLWIAREVHGHVPPTALFALPLAYGHPFIFGFVNFALSMALALLAFALWLRLARRGRLKLRAALFVVIGPLLWITHTFGWGTLGVLAFSAELIRQHDRGGSWPRAVFWAGIHCLSLTPPILLMVAWRSGHVSGATADWFNWDAKAQWLVLTLRDRWMRWDIAAVILLGLLPIGAVLYRGLELSRNLAASAAFLMLVFILLPRIVFGSAYADMRLTPYMLAIAVIAIRPLPAANGRVMSVLAMAGLAFFVARIGGNTLSFYATSRMQNRALVALDHVPIGARLVSFVGSTCAMPWGLNRNWHLPAIAMVRRQAYSNDQWDMAGAQLMRPMKGDAGYFRSDPSQVVIAGRCRNKWRSLDWSLATLPRGAFDYIWLIEPPVFDAGGLRGTTRIWSDGKNALYRIDDRAMSPQP
jgi:hypothetical protein